MRHFHYGARKAVPGSEAGPDSSQKRKSRNADSRIACRFALSGGCNRQRHKGPLIHTSNISPKDMRCLDVQIRTLLGSIFSSESAASTHCHYPVPIRQVQKETLIDCFEMARGYTAHMVVEIASTVYNSGNVGRNANMPPNLRLAPYHRLLCTIGWST